MRYIRTASLEELKGTALLRLDFNTEDDWRMKASLPTLEFLLGKADKVVILSHKGRPQGIDPKLSLQKPGEDLKALLGKEVKFISEFDFTKMRGEITMAPSGSVFLLENLRFLPGEERNDSVLAQELASLGSFYVNDAFAVSHRANSSVEAITKYLPSYAGLGLEKEIENLSKVMKSPEKPFVLILGGAKAEDKLEVVKTLQAQADSVLLGGAAANTLMELKGTEINGSLAAEHPEQFKDFLNFQNIFLPQDWVTKEGKILDIGPQSIEIFSEKIKNAKTVVWNGPMGMIEEAEYREGTKKLAEAVAENKSLFSIVGGGETIMFLKKMGLDKNISFISTGGGAMLEFLVGKELPGIKALEAYD